MATQSRKLKSSAVFIISLTVVGLLTVSPGISFADKYVTHVSEGAMNYYMGYETELDLPTPSTGALITSVFPGSRAGKAGFLSGDIIKSVNGVVAIDSYNLTVNIMELLKDKKVGEKMILTYGIMRDGVIKSINVTVGDQENDR